MISANEDNLRNIGEEKNSSMPTCILLQRVAQLVCGIGNRHLVHLINIWIIVKNHFVEVRFLQNSLFLVFLKNDVDYD